MILKKFRVSKTLQISGQQVVGGYVDNTDVEFGTDSQIYSNSVEAKKSPTGKKAARKLGNPTFKKQVVHTGLKGPSYKHFKKEMDRRFNTLYEEKLRQHPMHPDNPGKNNRSSESLGLGSMLNKKHALSQPSLAQSQANDQGQSKTQLTDIRSNKFVNSQSQIAGLEDGYYVFERLDVRNAGDGEPQNTLGQNYRRVATLAGDRDKQGNIYNSITSQGAFLLKFKQDFITDEPVLFMQQQTPFVISYHAVKQPAELYRVPSDPH